MVEPSTLTRRRVLGALGAAGLVPASAQTLRSPDQHFFQLMLGDLKRELEGARAEGRKGVLLVYEMDACPFCARFHKTVLRDAGVQDWYRRHFSVFRIDIRGANPVVGFDGKELSESDFAKQQRVRATPTSVFYDLTGKETVRFAGPARDVREFMQLGDFVVSGQWRSSTFDAYKARQP